ncbi:MAG: hypothetical protein KGY99_02635 [Phycisphaerae bacterium]|nr:hypothetical protein [Phycisphaerae bacterium]
MAELKPQIRLELPDEIGKLAELTEALRDAGVNILTLAAWVADGTGHMHLLPDDAGIAQDVLRGRVVRLDSKDVVTVTLTNEPGALNAPAATLAKAGIAIHHVHATTSGATALVVLDTSDNAKAASLL